MTTGEKILASLLFIFMAFGVIRESCLQNTIKKLTAGAVEEDRAIITFTRAGNMEFHWIK